MYSESIHTQAQTHTHAHTSTHRYPFIFSPAGTVLFSLYSSSPCLPHISFCTWEKTCQNDTSAVEKCDTPLDATTVLLTLTATRRGRVHCSGVKHHKNISIPLTIMQITSGWFLLIAMEKKNEFADEYKRFHWRKVWPRIVTSPYFHSLGLISFLY